MRSVEIGRRFLDFFAANQHTVVPSASLIADDPTLLLVNAGMVPFKPYFLGQAPAPWPRAASVQKVARTVDIDIVGTTSRHLSFFQMAGNFSFGDYFKERAIPLAWDLLTKSTADGGFGFPEDRLWATVYEDDDEAIDIWTRAVGLPAERVQRRGKADNYWHMGVAGPGGPCSEIYYDRGPDYGQEGGPVVDEDRFLEVWNLVFMQYSLSAVRSKEDFDVAGPLPKQNIDTGMGIERMAVVLQGVDNVYETDTLRPVLDRASELTGVRYGADDRSDVRLRVIAEHARTTTMLIADGVVPSNEGRGYVLRRMLRRVVRNARLLGADGPVIAQLVSTVRDSMSSAYRELVTDYPRIERVASVEEDMFLATLRSGTTLFEQSVQETRDSDSKQLSGDRAFLLHDTYGFPIDLTLEMAAEAGLDVDQNEFERLMQEQRHRAKADAELKKTGHVDVSTYRTLLDAAGRTDFVGYLMVSADARVQALLVDGEQATEAGEGTEVEIVLDRTPFYAEAGGQLADHGVIDIDGAIVDVLDVQRPIPDLVVHRARVRTGAISVGASAYADVDVERRRAISRAHTATHLTHSAIRRALGEEAAQAGSLNEPGRFRFDFTSPQAVPQSVLLDVEDEVNGLLLDDLEVRAFITSLDRARQMGALALFGEKYGHRVRVVEVGDYARELCGGTHTARSSQIGLVMLVSEGSIGAGVRRIEALVGLDAMRYLAREHVLVAQLSEALKAPAAELPERVVAITRRLRDVEKELESLRARSVLEAAPQLAGSPDDVFGVAVVTHEAPAGTSVDDARRLALDVRNRIDAARPTVVAIATVAKERPSVVVAVNDTGRDWGLKAGELVRVAASALGGGGGGADDLAQGGGTQPDAIAEALRALRDAVGARVTGSR